jgi:hypothetical protein
MTSTIPSAALVPIALAAWQRYEPLGNRVVRYQSSGYQAGITFDADGYVTCYQDYLERVG